MNPLIALDFSVKHKVVKDRIIASYDLSELTWELLRLFAYAARALHTDLGWLAITLALNEISNTGDEPWPARHAADLIVNHAMTVDVCIDPVLRDVGAYGIQQRWNVIDVTSDMVTVLAAIPETWFRVVPSLDVPLLEHFATELDEGCL